MKFCTCKSLFRLWIETYGGGYSTIFNKGLFTKV